MAANSLMCSTWGMSWPVKRAKDALYLCWSKLILLTSGFHFFFLLQNLSGTYRLLIRFSAHSPAIMDLVLLWSGRPPYLWLWRVAMALQLCWGSRRLSAWALTFSKHSGYFVLSGHKTNPQFCSLCNWGNVLDYTHHLLPAYTLVIRLPLSSTECMGTIFAGPGSQARASRTCGIWSTAVTGNTTAICSHYIPFIEFGRAWAEIMGYTFWLELTWAGGASPEIQRRRSASSSGSDHPVPLARSMFSSALLPRLWDWVTLPVLPSPRGGTVMT